MTGAYWDIEDYKNLFMVTFLDMYTPQPIIDEYIEADIRKDKVAKQAALSKMNIKTFIISDWKNDIISLIEFLRDIKLLVGFNSLKYDNLMLDYIYIFKEKYSRFESWQINDDLYGLSQNIISNNDVNYKWFDDDLKQFYEPYTTIDLYALVFETVQRKSLKQTAINLKWHRIQDLPIVYYATIKENQVIEIKDYNINDVLITRALHINKKGEVALRIGITEKYGVKVLTNNRSTIADKLIAKFYSDYTGLKYYQFKDKRTHRSEIKLFDIINPKIKFKTKRMQDCLDFLKGYIIKIDLEKDETKDKDKSLYKVFYDDIVYKVAKGGLHSIDRPRMWSIIDKPNMLMKDADVTSYYPNGVINEQVCPAHLALIAFQAIAKYVVFERTTAKREGRTIEADALKIVANSGLFGKFGFANGFLYDPQCVYQVTINLQLYLLMLIEELELVGAKVISANTDGITCLFHKDIEPLYDKVCKEWQSFTGFNLEFADYVKYIRTSVNDYIAIKRKWLKTNSDDDIKRKGDFLIEPDVVKGYSMPIVGIALDKYFVHGIPIETTIKEHKDIYDFCISVKTGEAFTKEIHFVKDGKYCTDELQKNIRYYVSTNGGGLNKHSKNTNQDFTMAKGVKVTIFNDFFYVNDFKEYNIDYNFYLHKAYEMIYKVTGANIKKTRKGVKQCGTMFDNI